LYAGDSTKRDPNDKDTRLKDFEAEDVLGGRNGVAFRNAFARNALVKLWGCTYEQEHRGAVKSYYRTKEDAEKKRIVDAYFRYIRESTYQYRLAKLLDFGVFAAPLGWGTDPDLPFQIYGQAAFDTAAQYRGIWPPKTGDKWWRVSAWFRPDR